MERVERRLRVNLPVSLDASDVARTEAELAALSRDRTVNLDIDTSSIDKISQAFSKVGAGGGRGGIGFLNPGVITAIVAAVGVLGAALPGLLVAVAAPLGAIVVGFDGIKRAAEGLAAPLAAMRATVADAFERGLTPVFQNLEKIFPTLTAGFVKITDAMTLMADAVVEKLVSADGLASLGAIFDNIADAMTVLAPAMGPFVDSLLILAEAGTAAFEKFAPLIAQLITDFNEFLLWAERSGVLTAAMDAIGFAIFAVIGFFGGLVAISIVAAAALTAFVAGVKFVVNAIIGFVSSLPGKVSAGFAAMKTSIVSNVTSAWNSASAAFSSGVNRVVGFARSLPGKITAALGSLAGKLKSIGVNAMNGLWQGLVNGAGRVLSKARDIASSVASTIAGALDVFSPSRVMMEIGEYVTEGLRRGIASGQGDLERTMLDTAGIVSGIRTNLDLGGVGGRGGVAGAGGITQIINPRETQSEYEIARQSNNRLLWALGNS